MTTCTCVICRKPYDPEKSRAYHRGYCSRACEKVAEDKCGFAPKESAHSETNRHASSKFSKLSMELRRITPGADPVEPATAPEPSDNFRQEYTMTVQIILPPGMTENEMMKAVLEGECTLNANSRVRFHFGEPKKI